MAIRFSLSVRRLFAGVLALAGMAFAEPREPMQIGVISYWSPASGAYNQLPEDSLALINPDNGIFISQGQTTTLSPNIEAYRSIVRQASRRGVTMLGYVPTGYFRHDCSAGVPCQSWARIEAQVAAYFREFPRLAGIFFDETAPAAWDCAAFPAEFQRLRDIVYRYRDDATIAFNAAVPDNCAVAAAEAGEILVLFENTQAAYAEQATNVAVSTATALAKGVIPWHLVHTVKGVADMQSLVARARSLGAGYFYATDIGGNWQAGENTWGSLPAYWPQEVALFSGDVLEGGADVEEIPACRTLTGDISLPVDPSVRGLRAAIQVGVRLKGGVWLMRGPSEWVSVARGESPPVYRSEVLGTAIVLPKSLVSEFAGAGIPRGARVVAAYALDGSEVGVDARYPVCAVRP